MIRRLHLIVSALSPLACVASLLAFVLFVTLAFIDALRDPARYDWAGYGILVAVACVFMAPSLCGFVREMLIARRQEEGRCLRCGYDLRATRERCPECGTPLSPTKPGFE